MRVGPAVQWTLASMTTGVGHGPVAREVDKRPEDQAGRDDGQPRGIDRLSCELEGDRRDEDARTETHDHADCLEPDRHDERHHRSDEQRSTGK